MTKCIIEVYIEHLIDYFVIQNWFNPSKETEATKCGKPGTVMAYVYIIHPKLIRRNLTWLSVAWENNMVLASECWEKGKKLFSCLTKWRQICDILGTWMCNRASQSKHKNFRDELRQIHCVFNLWNFLLETNQDWAWASRHHTNKGLRWLLLKMNEYSQFYKKVKNFEWKCYISNPTGFLVSWHPSSSFSTVLPSIR